MPFTPPLEASRESVAESAARPRWNGGSRSSRLASGVTEFSPSARPDTLSRAGLARDRRQRGLARLRRSDPGRERSSRCSGCSSRACARCSRAPGRSAICWQARAGLSGPPRRWASAARNGSTRHLRDPDVIVAEFLAERDPPLREAPERRRRAARGARRRSRGGETAGGVAARDRGCRLPGRCGRGRGAARDRAARL